MKRIDETDSNERVTRSLPRLLVWVSSLLGKRGGPYIQTLGKNTSNMRAGTALNRNGRAKRKQQREGGNSPAILVTLANGAAM